MAESATFTVIGGGIAGTLACLELVRRGRDVTWHTDPARPPCSAIAAGMYNPITGKRFAKTWQVDTLQPFMLRYYRDIEQETGSQFLHPQPVMKLFTDEEERGRWEQRKNDEEFVRLASPLVSDQIPPGVTDPGYGGFVVREAGSVRIPVLLEAVRTMLADRVQVIDTPYETGDDTESTVIHCEGFHASANPLFTGIPFRHAHGDVLTIRAPGLGNTHILNTGVYVLPLDDDIFRVGATYDWNRTDPSPTEAGRDELTARLRDLLTVPFELVDHEAGIRPATRRRTPVLGRLPDNPRHVLFNGLGSKGVLLAPYYARHLAEHLLDAAPLDREVDVQTHLS